MKMHVLISSFALLIQKAYIPQFYLDAIYKDVPGAKFDEADGVYWLPCDAYVNVTFVFA